MVGLLAGTPASICLRARLQTKMIACISCSAFFVISRTCRRVISISLIEPGFDSSAVNSATAANTGNGKPVQTSMDSFETPERAHADGRIALEKLVKSSRIGQ